MKKSSEEELRLMSTMHSLLSLSPERSTAQIGWHSRASAYTDAYLDQIIDPANTIPQRMLTAIPSPFARLHLVDTAFGFIAHAGKDQHHGTSVFHKLVSECFDVLELLYRRDAHASPVEILKWVPSEDLRPLEASADKGQQLLASVLKLFLNEESETTRFDPSFALIMASGQALAVSSPLTLFASAPNCEAIAQDTQLINPTSGDHYFSKILALHERSPEFQLYIHALFRWNPSLANSAGRMQAYVADSAQLLRDVDPGLASRIHNLALTGDPAFRGSLSPIEDSIGSPLIVAGVQLLQRSKEDIIERLKGSPRTLNASRKVAELPIILTDFHDSFGNRDAKTRIPDATDADLSKRILPDLNITFPFLTADDLIEPRIVRLPFKTNTQKFWAPQVEGVSPEDDYSYLLPLKREFFNYFAPHEVPSLVKLKRIGDGVSCELTIPTKGGRVVLTKLFYDSKEMKSAGQIVGASMNCAIFPFLVVTDHPEFSNRYWVMLVDAEIDPKFRGRDCFFPTFYRESSGRFVPIADDRNAKPHVLVTKRSQKGVQGGSTYFELLDDEREVDKVRGAWFDFIQLDIFPHDPERSAKAIIAPRWDFREMGNQEAVVAVDFGTTNSHLAWSLSDPRNPATLQTSPSDLQVALLNSPRDILSNESAQYDKFGARLVATEIRLHHEFLPSIIGKNSPFRFPLRTATSEIPNLSESEYETLRNINISFSFGRTAQRPDEQLATNLKWSAGRDLRSKERVRRFLEELLLIARTKLLLNGVAPDKTRLVWFRPLSFNRSTTSAFDGAWSTLASEIFRANNVINITESEAPYYYHRARARIITSKPVVCVDIGGGSTDVIFFDHNIPQFGTSFSFAGNALWGSGYDLLGNTQTGVVRRYQKIIKERISHIPNEEDRDRVTTTYDDLLAHSTSAAELVNFFFSIDEFVGFSRDITSDGEIKCLILVHYLAIIYHCAQLLKESGMVAPEFICFSGRGARYLHILDPTHNDVDPARNKKEVGVLTQEMFAEVYGTRPAQPILILLAPDSKEATCNGGILMGTQRNPEIKTVIGLGDGTIPASSPCFQDIDASTRDRVASNLEHFVDTILAIDKRLNFKDTFGIPPAALRNVRSVLTSKLSENITFGLEHHGYSDNLDEPINETLFFYPLTQKLFELGNVLIPET